MQEKKTLITFEPEDTPESVVSGVSQESKQEDLREDRVNTVCSSYRSEAFTAIPARSSSTSYRQTPDGKPSNGDPNDFENNFSLTDKSGIRYDFRDGLRIMIPKDLGGEYHIVAEDAESRFRVVDTVLKAGGSVMSCKKWFVPWDIVVTKDGKPVMEHTLDLKGKEVAIHIPKAGLGDTIAWFSYAEPFMEKTGCVLTCCMEKRFRVLFESEYPRIKWEDEDTWRHTPFYAVYHMGIYTPDNEFDHQPEDFRLNGLHHAAGLILGLGDSLADRPPRVAAIDPTMPVPANPYVCIATSASARCKEWLNPNGWPVVVDWLKTQGYNIVDIDRDFVHGGQGTLSGVVDDTGDLDLRERVGVLKGAKAFVGVSSGLSWLAWASGTPVVLISGWTLPRTEFHTPYRVINRFVCHGCWNDGREDYDHFDGNYCPRHKDTPREHECSKGISSYQVLVQLSKALGVEL